MDRVATGPCKLPLSKLLIIFLDGRLPLTYGNRGVGGAAAPYPGSLSYTSPAFASGICRHRPNSDIYFRPLRGRCPPAFSQEAQAALTELADFFASSSSAGRELNLKIAESGMPPYSKFRFLVSSGLVSNRCRRAMIAPTPLSPAAVHPGTSGYEQGSLVHAG